MRRSRPSTAGAYRRLALAFLVATGLAVVTVPAAVQAHEGEQLEDCPPGVKEKLEAAGDNFADACREKGSADRLAAPGAAAANEAEIPVGSLASSGNIGLIANLPKQGDFAAETAFNSDLAFKGRYAFAGNYQGFMVYDIRKPSQPKVVAQVLCPGSQNDVSVWKNLLVLSVDSSRSNDTCTNEPQSATIKESWEGIRVFDISDPANPQFLKSVETPCGSHTHTLAPDDRGRNLYVYVSSYNPDASFPDCQPPHDRISIVKIPRSAPDAAYLQSSPVLFPDGGMPAGGYSRETSGCHDITAYPERDIAAGACMGDGILMDISDREDPVVTEQVRDEENFAFWHSATFNNSGDKVVFTDELGGGGGPTCNPTVGPDKGANGIYDIKRGKLVFRSYYKITRTQSDFENCVAHNGSLVPVKGRDIMVQAWYQGGISVFDFTDSAKPKEIAWIDRGPLSDERLILGGSWSAYWYNGYIYSNDIQKGLDVFDIRDRRVERAKGVKLDVFNAQSQPSYNG